MSIPSEINRIKNNIASTYSAIEERGGALPEERSSDNLANAVNTIPVGVTEERLAEVLLGKQDKLTGTHGQVVGFNTEGMAVAQDPPEGGVGSKIMGKVEMLFAAKYGLEVQIEQLVNDVVKQDTTVFSVIGDSFKSSYQGSFQSSSVTTVRIVPPTGLAFNNLHWTGTLTLNVGSYTAVGFAESSGAIVFSGLAGLISNSGATTFSFKSGGADALFKVELA